MNIKFVVAVPIIGLLVGCFARSPICYSNGYDPRTSRSSTPVGEEPTRFQECKGMEADRHAEVRCWRAYIKQCSTNNPDSWLAERQSTPYPINEEHVHFAEQRLMSPAERRIASRGPEYAKTVSMVDEGRRLAESGGGKRSDRQAVVLFKNACDKGNPLGCANLGTMYVSGRGVEKKPKRAIELFQKACDDDCVYGCTQLGLQFAVGEVVEQDFSKAVKLFDKACETVNMKAGAARFLNLPGRPGGKNDRVENDEAALRACQYLGLFYKDGKGVEKSHVKSQDYYMKACWGGWQAACSSVEKTDSCVSAATPCLQCRCRCNEGLNACVSACGSKGVVCLQDCRSAAQSCIGACSCQQP